MVIWYRRDSKNLMEDLKMNKNELVTEIYSKIKATKKDATKKDAETGLNAVIAAITEALAEGEKVQLIGFGTFETKERAAREGRNPRKPGETIKIPACKAPAFKAGKALKDAVNK